MAPTPNYQTKRNAGDHKLFAKEGQQENHTYFAAGTYDPYLSRLLDPTDDEYYVENARLLIDSDDPRVQGLVVDIMITKRKFLNSHAAALRSLLTGWFRAVDILNDPSHADYPKAIDIACKFNGLPLDAADWSWKTWPQNVPCAESAYAEMIDGLRGRRRREEDKQLAWPNLKENKLFFKRPGGHPSQYDKVFNACKELREGTNLDLLDPSDFDGSAMVFDSVD